MNTATAFNYDLHLREINERFSRLVKQLGINNKKGTDRYLFEVEFSYALNELKNSPPHQQEKYYFEVANGIINELITHLKAKQGDKPQERAA